MSMPDRPLLACACSRQQLSPLVVRLLALLVLAVQVAHSRLHVGTLLCFARVTELAPCSE